MPERHFLSSQESLSQQVAAFLPESVGKGTLLITPTAGATRRISRLAGLTLDQTKTVAQPMQALLPELDNIASPVERCLAWATALRDASLRQRQTLFWKQAPESTAELIKAGRNFIRLCDRLTEAGLSPQTLQLPDQLAGSFDEGRWSTIATLYQDYIECLQGWNLHDPNALRINTIEQSDDTPQQIILACIPDLPLAFEKYAARLENEGTRVDVLIWNPQDADADSFDLWGRPTTEIWNGRLIEIDEKQIHTAASALDEAQAAVPKITQPNAGLVVADPQLNAIMASEIRAQKHEPHLPEGTPLMRCEAAKLSLEWSAFRQSKDLRSLRRLLELPAFCRALDTENPLSQSDALIAIDHLLGKTIASHLDAAWAASPNLNEDAPSRELQMRAKVRRLLGLLRSQLNRTTLELIETAYPEEDTRTKATERILEITRALEASPAVSNWAASKDEGTVPVQVLTQAIRNEQIQTPPEEESVTLNGWLEAPWLEEEHIVLSGLVEGRLPQSVDGDPFLPDSICPILGISHNAQRLARDAYLLDALLASRPTDQVQLSFSKYNNEGDPNRPSRLLFRTDASELPQRVEHLTSAASAITTRARRETNWRWQIPEGLEQVEKISPTQFEAYLACPFRFCFNKTLHLDSGPQAAREMDAAVFGNLIHYTLENYGRTIIPSGDKMLQLDEASIRKEVQRLLQEEATRQFGPHPSPAVRVQIANAEARLHAFARVQADCFAQGWVILDVERKLEADGGDALSIGPLKLSGIIDRIEQHAKSGQLRVMDYKTFSSPKKPSETHFGPTSHNWLEEALVDVHQKRGLKQKTWKNLQLPLYRRIIEHWYPKESKAATPTTAYFVLPSDPNESGICPFEEIDAPENSELYESAITCAEAVAKHITKGIYWPPQPFRGSWDDPIAPILVNGAVEDCIAPETIEQLKGGIE